MGEVGRAAWRGRRSLEEAAAMGQGVGWGGRVQQRGAGVSCAHQHNTNQFGSSHTAGQEASPKCTAAPSPLYRHVSNGVYRSGGEEGQGWPVGGRSGAGPPRPAAASLASAASRPGPGLRGAARGAGFARDTYSQPVKVT